jgi:hypothetical protein
MVVLLAGQGFRPVIRAHARPQALSRQNASLVKELRGTGVQIHHILPRERQGFRAISHTRPGEVRAASPSRGIAVAGRMPMSGDRLDEHRRNPDGIRAVRHNKCRRSHRGSAECPPFEEAPVPKEKIVLQCLNGSLMNSIVCPFPARACTASLPSRTTSVSKIEMRDLLPQSQVFEQRWPTQSGSMPDPAASPTLRKLDDTQTGTSAPTTLGGSSCLYRRSRYEAGPEPTSVTDNQS